MIHLQADTSGEQSNIISPFGLKRFGQFNDQRLIYAIRYRDAYHMDIIVNGQPGGLQGRLVAGADINVKSELCQRSRQRFCPAV
jgi:hypothetical protein